MTDETVAPGDSEFIVAVDGKTLGRMTSFERDEQRVFLHTEVDEAYGGRGLATQLITQGLAATRAEGMRIVAVCPMVAAYVQKHHEYDDIVDRPTREIMLSLQ